MDAQKYSALKVWNAWMSQLLESVLCVELVLKDTLVTQQNVMVSTK